MSTYAYYNGEFINYEKVRIPLTDRSVFFGDGVYDAAIGEHGNIFCFEEHYERFRQSAIKVGLLCEIKKEELFETIAELISRSKLESYFIYFQLSAHGDERSHERRSEKTNFLTIIKPWVMPNPQKCVRICTEKDVRHSLCDVKTLNLLPAVIAATGGAKKGYDECLFVKNSYVTECAHSNIFSIKNEVLRTPPPSESVLGGITASLINEIARDIGFCVKTENFTLQELVESDDVFITSTSKFCPRVCEIDRKKMGVPTNCYNEISRRFYMRYLDVCRNLTIF